MNISTAGEKRRRQAERLVVAAPGTDTGVAGRTPAEALNRAQRWILAPNRRPPDGMPAELRDRYGPETIFGPESWGGIIHVGR